MNRRAAEDWIRTHVEPVGAIEMWHERPWATVLRVPHAEGVAWFKACAPVQVFEPRLTAELFATSPPARLARGSASHTMSPSHGSILRPGNTPGD